MDWPTLDETDLRRCYDLAIHRAAIGSTPEGEKLKLRIASMGDYAGKLMSRYIRHLGITRIFEIGTCAGIGAAYMCSAAEAAGHVTFDGMEGVEAKRAYALETLDMFCPNTEVTIHPGHFDDSFEPALAAALPLQFVYLDGRHQREPSLHMFQRIIDNMPEGGIIVADDLDHASMGDCRKKFRNNPRTLSHFSFARKESFTIGAQE